CKIACLRNDRTRRGTKADAHLLRHDLRERRLTEARRAGEQHMIEGIAAAPGRLDKDAEIAARRLLADEFVERLWPDRRLESINLSLDARNQPVPIGVAHRTYPVEAGRKPRPELRRSLGRAPRVSHSFLQLLSDLPRRCERRSRIPRGAAPL